MTKSQQVKFELLYRKHLSALRRQGKADETTDVYARAVRRLAEWLGKYLKLAAAGCRD